MATTRMIELVTEIPGPRSREIGERIERVVARPLAITFPIVAASGRGATLTDVDGNTFIDFAGGVGCLNVGHSHPEVVAAAHEQLDRFSHTDFTVVPYELYVALAERLSERAPISGPVKAAFFNAGTEAVENAVKFARAYTGRPAVIAFEGGLPRAHAALAVAHLEGAPLQGRASGRSRPRSTACPSRTPTAASSVEDALAALERALRDRRSRRRRVAAIMLEPVQGEGGFIVAPPEFVAGVRAICDRHGIVLVADEVQTGFGRTGRFFAIEHSGVEPDLICVAKSIANGLPLSGVLGRAEIMDAPVVGGVGGTYVGNPVAQAAALAVLDVIDDEGLRRALRGARRDDAARACSPGRSAGRRSARCAASARCSRSSSSPIRPRGSRRRSSPTRVTEAALQRGLLLITCGVYGNCIRVLVPLVITDAELEEALGAWEEALEAVLG